MNLLSKVKPFFLIALLFLASCSDADESAQVEEPVLPPSYSMSPDFNNFSGSENNRHAATIENWLYAATNVTVYSSILSVSLAVPVTAFTTTIGQEPIFDPELGVWQWSNTFDLPSGTYEIRLTALVNAPNVDWTGYIRYNGGATEFVWFDGTSRLDGTSGNWNLYESPSNPSVWMSAEWSRNFSNNSGEARFTVEKEGINQGSFIHYEVNASNDLNRAVLINDVNKTSDVEVQWNEEGKDGRVRSEMKYGDNEYHCWDQQLQDIDC